jgi:hypothetical protein
MLEFYMAHREEFLTHYHKLSNVQTTFHMIKSKFGLRLRSKTLTAQINEALCKLILDQEVRCPHGGFSRQVAQHSYFQQIPISSQRIHRD